jgi:hypothetical protein
MLYVETPQGEKQVRCPSARQELLSVDRQIVVSW